jgi:hypothetical protein
MPGFSDLAKEATRFYSDVKKEPSKHVLQLSTYLADVTKETLDDLKQLKQELQQTKALQPFFRLSQEQPQHAMQADAAGADRQQQQHHQEGARYQTPAVSAVLKCRYTSFSIPMPWQ